MHREAARRLLGVRPGVAANDIEAAFRRAARSAHPDRGGDAELFRDLVTARDLLVARLAGRVDGPVLTIRRSPGRRLYRAVRARLPSVARRHLT